MPKEVRDALGIRVGDSLVFEVENGGARVRVNRKPVSFADYASVWRVGDGMSWEEINAHVRGMRGHEDDGRSG